MFHFVYRFMDWLRSLLWHKEMEITIVGLQEAGKTTLVNIIARDGCTDTIPTIGFNARKITYGRTSIKIWDLGGERRFRNMWERYCRGVSAILYMVDAVDWIRLEESRRELHCLLRKHQLVQIPLLVLGNKIDLPNALGEEDFIDRMDLKSLEDRQVCCFMTSCKSKENIENVLKWLLKHSPN